MTNTTRNTITPSNAATGEHVARIYRNAASGGGSRQTMLNRLMETPEGRQAIADGASELKQGGKPDHNALSLLRMELRRAGKRSGPDFKVDADGEHVTVTKDGKLGYAKARSPKAGGKANPAVKGKGTRPATLAECITLTATMAVAAGATEASLLAQVKAAYRDAAAKLDADDKAA